VTGEWGWKDGWFSEAGLLAATEDECESTEVEKGGGFGDGVQTVNPQSTDPSHDTFLCLSPFPPASPNWEMGSKIKPPPLYTRNKV